MPEMRKDPLTGIWVTLAPERKLRPQFVESAFSEPGLDPAHCPFCPGNEHLTTKEIYALRPRDSVANSKGWELRVVPNKFPALRVEGELKRRAEGLYDKVSGIGAHEVVIETADHHRSMADFSHFHLEKVLLAYKSRILDLKQDIRFRYIQVFKNHGARAGATIPHPHSQIVAMPEIPARVMEKIKRTQAYYKEKERCLCCDILDYELNLNSRTLLVEEGFCALAPYAPRLPFELVIYPRQHQARFEDMDDSLFSSLAGILKKILGKLNRALELPAFNLVLQTAPMDRECASFFHWHLEVLPITNGTGGFELGTSSYINPIPPGESVRILKTF